MPEFLKKNKDIIILWTCIVVHTIILYKICDFRKSLETYGDDFAYYSMARSIFNGRGTEVHGVPFPFQNLAYVFFLVPLFGISNSVARMHVITLANSFLMSLCILPTWLICKELKLNRKYTWFVIIIMMVWPDHLTAGTMMSENLYWPISLFALYFCIRSLNSKHKCWSVVAAVFCYLAYWCKEVAICISLAYVGIVLLYPIITSVFCSEYLEKKKEKIGDIFRRYYIKDKTLINLILFSITFILIYILFKKILFNNVENYYEHQLGSDFFSHSYSAFYFLYGIFYYTIASIIAFMVIPVMYPLIHLKKLDENTKKSYIYAMMLLLGTIIVIAFTITVKEDIGRVAPRIHLRYYASIIGLLLPVFFKTLSIVENDPKYSDNYRKKSLVMWIVTGIVCVFAYKGVQGGCANENLALIYSQYLLNKFPILRNGNNDAVVFYPSAFVITIVIVAILLLWSLLESSKKGRKYCSVFICAIMIGVCGLNTLLGAVNLRNTYGSDFLRIVEMSKINNYFKDNNMGQYNVMFVSKSWGTKDAKIYDTYFDGENNFEISYETLINKMYESGNADVDVKQTQFSEIVWGSSYSIDTIDYIILGDGINDLNGIVGGLELVQEISSEYFSVYKNLDSTTLALPTEDVVGSENNLVEINFTDVDFNANLFAISGLSYCEGSHTWTDGNELVIRALVPKSVNKVNVQFDLVNTFYGNQEIIVYQADQIIYHGIANSAHSFSFELSPNSGNCGFKIYLPNAISPADIGESADTRKLALDLQKISISKVN